MQFTLMLVYTVTDRFCIPNFIIIRWALPNFTFLLTPLSFVFSLKLLSLFLLNHFLNTGSLQRSICLRPVETMAHCSSFLFALCPVNCLLYVFLFAPNHKQIWYVHILAIKCSEFWVHCSFPIFFASKLLIHPYKENGKLLGVKRVALSYTTLQ